MENVHSVSRHGIEIVCAYGRSRICHPIACAWLADHPKKMSFLGLSLHSCSYCEVPPHYLGKYREQYPIRDHAKYRQIIRGEHPGHPGLDEIEKSQRIKRITSNTGLKQFSLTVWKLKDVNYHELYAHDVLHCIWIGVFKRLMTWTMELLKKYQQLDSFY